MSPTLWKALANAACDRTSCSGIKLRRHSCHARSMHFPAVPTASCLIVHYLERLRCAFIPDGMLVRFRRNFCFYRMILLPSSGEAPVQSIWLGRTCSLPASNLAAQRQLRSYLVEVGQGLSSLFCRTSGPFVLAPDCHRHESTG